MVFLKVRSDLFGILRQTQNRRTPTPAGHSSAFVLAIAFWSAGVNRCVIEPVGMTIAIMINPLVQSVLNQNTEAELWACPRECRQCGSAMSRSEEARFRRLMGLRLGRIGGRASPHWAKSAVSVSFRRLPAAAGAVSGGRSDLVARAITQDSWLDHITDEVSRGLPPRGSSQHQLEQHVKIAAMSWRILRRVPSGVNPGYKLRVKGPDDASATGTVSYRPRSQRWQQRRSSRVPLPGRDERQNLKQPVQAPATRIVSRVIKATKWLAGTSFRQITPALRNIRTGAAAAVDGSSTTS
jgi:hypothetical protein